MWAKRRASGVGAVGLLLVMGPVAAEPVAAAGLHVTCSARGLIRQVEVREHDPARDAACAVLYRKESENPGIEEVLWTAQRDSQFCDDKARGLIERLESAGWACEPVDPAATGPEIIEARVPPERKPAATTPGAQVEQPRVPPQPQPEPSAGTQVEQSRVPPEPKPEPPAAGAQVGQVRVAPELQPQPAPTVPATARPGREPDPVLRTAIAQDLEQLKGSAEATVDADIGALGDLNGDGLEDAAVVITFDPDGDDHAQYLVAYVADGTTYRPAASKFLGGRYRQIYGGEVQDIREGTILVSLHVLKADDPYCCPSGQQPATFTLRGEELLRRD